MNSLSDKLKALGVKQGMSEIRSSQPKKLPGIQDIIPGSFHTTIYGDVFISQTTYNSTYTHGVWNLDIDFSLGIIAAWLNNLIIEFTPKEKICFIDTETTGLSGGTGTIAFLIGIGYFEGNQFQIKQIFLQNPSEEPAQLTTLDSILSTFDIIVSYNGKAFDIPILKSRFALQGWNDPFHHLYHIDLLTLTRRLWKDRLSSKSLSNIESQILKFTRSEEDIPGWMVPQYYFNYLLEGDIQPLKSIFYHNNMDILSLAVLLNVTSQLLDPQKLENKSNPFDIVSLARIYEGIGKTREAINLYSKFFQITEQNENDIPIDLTLNVLYRLAQIYKRNGVQDLAIYYWMQASKYKDISAFIELAKIFEHILRDYEQAIYWLQAAKNIVNDNLSISIKNRWLQEIDHRINRIQRKMTSK